MTSLDATPASVPVTSNGVPVRNLWYMLLYAWRQQQFIGKWQVEVEEAPTLDALLASILCKLVEQRMRIGLGRDYRQHDQTIAGVRGRLDFTTSLKRLTFEKARAHCRFQV